MLYLETTMDQKRYEDGLAARRAVLGDEYVDKATQNVDDFNRKFQELVSEFCWGECCEKRRGSRRGSESTTLGRRRCSRC